MSTLDARDHAELEAATSAEPLRQWRETRNSDRYREWCLETFGGYVVIGEHKFHPADVLRLKEGVTEKSMTACWSQLLTQDDDTVCDQFPAPVAIPYHQVIYGPREPIRRLTRMRDTWEGLINLLTAMVIAEAAEIGVGPAPVEVIETASRRPMRYDDLRSDRLAIRVGVLEGIIESWRDAGVRSVLGDLIPLGLPAELRRLNTVRNSFSHLGTLSDPQANRLVEESRPILHEVLVDCLFLADTQLVRLTKVTPGLPPSAEVDSLNGNSTSRHIRDLDLDQDTQRMVMRAGRIGTFDRVLAIVGSRCLDLSPFFYACDDDSGHHTRIAFFKKRTGGQCHLEVVGEALELESEVALHDPEFERCKRAILDGRRGGGDE